MYRKISYTDLPYRYLPAIVIILSFISVLVLLQSQSFNLSLANTSFTSPLAIDVLSGTGHFNSSVRRRRLPQAIIIGSRKSGTRALLKFLEVNPKIKSAAREVHFFDRSENYRKGLVWYREQMPETADSEITIEKSPAYFVTEEVPERIKAMNSSIKLIVIFRDPVTRLISDYSQLIANKLESPANYVQIHGYGLSNVAPRDAETDRAWLNAGHDFKRHVLTPDGRIDEQRRMVKVGMYSSYLEKWLAVFPRDHFHFVNGEKLIVEPHVELKKLEEFLGVKPSIKREHFVFNTKKGFYCLTGTILSTSAPNKFEKNLTGPICLSKSKGRRHVVVSDDIKMKLADLYAPYNEYLFSLTNMNLSRAKL